METRKGRRALSALLILLGLAMLDGALGLVLHNMRENNRAAEASQYALARIIETRPELRLPEPTIPPTEGGMEEYVEPVIPDMPTKEIDGWNYIGTLAIPSLELELPVMDDWDMDRLKYSPCVYKGSYYTDDLVICGHNFPSHFSPIKFIEIGAEVTFTNVEGVVYRYIVSNRETVRPMDVDYMIDNQSDKSEKWDLTLFTCNTGGQTRCAVRCIRADG